MSKQRILQTVILAFLVLAAPAVAEVGGWLHFAGDPTKGHVAVPHHPELNPTGAITIEAWVKVTATNCRSIAGKGWTTAYWLGVCSTTLRSYFRGSAAGSLFDAGTVPADVWTHIAATYNGVTHAHYINGVLANSRAEAGALAVNTLGFRIGSDAAWDFVPQGDIDEVRLWNVARTGAEILANMNKGIQNGVPGLVAVWSLDGNADDAVGGHHGALGGVTTLDDFQVPAPPAGAYLTSAEFADFRFKARIAGSTIGTQVPDCQIDTLCVAGAIPDRAEIMVRIVGPRANGLLWPNVIKFTTSRVEVWIEQISTGKLEYYDLAGANPNFDRLPGIFDREGFVP
jgi:hypothetical protein